MESPKAPSHLTLYDPDRSESVGVRSLISHRRAKLNHMVQLDIKREPHIGSLMAPLSHLTLSDVETA